jgi:hypothetical protein
MEAPLHRHRRLGAARFTRPQSGHDRPTAAEAATNLRLTPAPPKIELPRPAPVQEALF